MVICFIMKVIFDLIVDGEVQDLKEGGRWIVLVGNFYELFIKSLGKLPVNKSSEPSLFGDCTRLIKLDRTGIAFNFSTDFCHHPVTPYISAKNNFPLSGELPRPINRNVIK